MQISQCPKPLQDAFVESLSAIAVSEPGQPTSRAIDQAYRSLVEWELLQPSVAAAERRAADTTYMQTLLLMAIEADTRPPSTAGPPKEAILGRAVSGAISRKLHQFRPKQQDTSIFQHGAESNVPLRIWWSLVVLDRWHAVSTGSHTLIPKRHMNAPAGFKNYLGESFYYLLREFASHDNPRHNTNPFQVSQESLGPHQRSVRTSKTRPHPRRRTTRSSRTSSTHGSRRTAKNYRHTSHRPTSPSSTSPTGTPASSSPSWTRKPPRPPCFPPARRPPPS